MNNIFKRIFRGKNPIKILIALIILALLFASAGDDLLKGASELSLEIIILLFLLQITTLILVAYQWHYIFKTKIDVNITFNAIFRINLAAKFIESITPAAKLGGESARILLFSRLTGKDAGSMLAGVSLQKTSSMLGLTIFFLPFILFWPYNLDLEFLSGSNTLFPSLRSGLTLITVPALIIVLFLHGKLKDSLANKIKNLYKNTLSSLMDIFTVKTLFALTFIALLFWGLYPIKVYVIAGELGGEVSLIEAAAATFLAYMVSMVPLTPGGLGSFEAVMALVLRETGMSWEGGVTAAILLRIFTFWLPLLASVLSAMSLSLDVNYLGSSEQ